MQRLLKKSTSQQVNKCPFGGLRQIRQLDNWTNALFGIVLLDRAGKKVFAVTKLQQEVT